jgi:ComF family protein
MDALFPIFCIACGAEGAWLCGGCVGEAALQGVFTCVGCRRETPGGSTCERCRKLTPVEQLIAVDRYGTGVTSELVRLWKYKSLRSVEPFLTSFVRRFFESRRALFPETSLIVPVPLHLRRECERGFNQAEALSGILGTLMGAEVVNVLERRRYTTPQVKIPEKKDREKNMSGVFRCRDADAIRGKDILLVDDVVTSGATITQCARTLAESGAGRIFGFSLLRG